MDDKQVSYVRVELIGNRGELILNRPEQKNSLIGPLVKQLLSGLNELSNNEMCHAILIRGEGGCFCAGLDVKAFFSEIKPDWLGDFHNDWLAFHSAVYACRKPVIGALERFAIAGGSSLAFSCDFLVVGEKSFLHVAEVELGMAAPINVAWLTLKYGTAKALELALLGERHYGADLVRLGLATRCVDDAETLNEARKLADRLASFDSLAVQSLKSSIYKAQDHGSFDALVGRIKHA
ncbi:MAG: enoyl-CoA hydratase/carnithine racemase [Oceanicoccus sp.]|jgi:enoyl-CoA hydratase/carnithine racemase